MIKKIQISDDLFWGFNTIIDLTNYSSFRELELLLVKELVLFLRRNNLLYLADKAEKINLHNHNYDTYEDLFKTDNEIIYFCGHCCE